MLHLIQRISVFALIASAGCASTPRATIDRESQLRTLRQENDRQARRIGQLESRISLAEDTARSATRAVSSLARNTIHITDDGSNRSLHGSAEVEAIPTSLHEDSGEEEASQEEPNRPVVRAG